MSRRARLATCVADRRDGGRAAGARAPARGRRGAPRARTCTQLALLVLGNLSSTRSTSTRGRPSRSSSGTTASTACCRTSGTRTRRAPRSASVNCTTPPRCGDAGARRRGAADAADADDGGVRSPTTRGCLKNMSEATAGKVASLWQQVSSLLAAARIRRAAARRLPRDGRRVGGADRLVWLRPAASGAGAAAAAPRRAWFGGGAPAPAPAAARPKPPGRRCRWRGVRPLRRGGEAAGGGRRRRVRGSPERDQVRPAGSPSSTARTRRRRRAAGRRPRPRAARRSAGGRRRRARYSRAALLLALLSAPRRRRSPRWSSRSRSATPTPAWSSRRRVDVADGGALVELDAGVEQRWFWLNELYHRGAAPSTRPPALAPSWPSRPVASHASGSATRALTCAVDAWCCPHRHLRPPRATGASASSSSRRGARCRRAPPPTSTTTAPAPSAASATTPRRAKLELLVGTASFGAYAVAVRAAVCVVAIALALSSPLRAAGADGTSSGADGVQLTPRARSRRSARRAGGTSRWRRSSSSARRSRGGSSTAPPPSAPRAARRRRARRPRRRRRPLASARAAPSREGLPLGALYVAAAAWGAYKLTRRSHAHHLELPCTALTCRCCSSPSAPPPSGRRSSLRWVARQPGGRAQSRSSAPILGASLVAEVAWVPVQEQLSTAAATPAPPSATASPRRPRRRRRAPRTCRCPRRRRSSSSGRCQRARRGAPRYGVGEGIGMGGAGRERCGCGTVKTTWNDASH